MTEYFVPAKGLKIVGTKLAAKANGASSAALCVTIVSPRVRAVLTMSGRTRRSKSMSRAWCFLHSAAPNVVKHAADDSGEPRDRVDGPGVQAVRYPRYWLYDSEGRAVNGPVGKLFDADGESNLAWFSLGSKGGTIRSTEQLVKPTCRFDGMAMMFVEDGSRQDRRWDETTSESLMCSTLVGVVCIRQSEQRIGGSTLRAFRLHSNRLCPCARTGSVCRGDIGLRRSRDDRARDVWRGRGHEWRECVGGCSRNNRACDVRRERGHERRDCGQMDMSAPHRSGAMGCVNDAEWYRGQIQARVPVDVECHSTVQLGSSAAQNRAEQSEHGGMRDVTRMSRECTPIPSRGDQERRKLRWADRQSAQGLRILEVDGGCGINSKCPQAKIGVASANKLRGDFGWWWYKPRSLAYSSIRHTGVEAVVTLTSTPASREIVQKIRPAHLLRTTSWRAFETHAGHTRPPSAYHLQQRASHFFQIPPRTAPPRCSPEDYQAQLPTTTSSPSPLTSSISSRGHLIPALNAAIDVFGAECRLCVKRVKGKRRSVISSHKPILARRSPSRSLPRAPAARTPRPLPSLARPFPASDFQLVALHAPNEMIRRQDAEAESQNTTYLNAGAVRRGGRDDESSAVTLGGGTTARCQPASTGDESLIMTLSWMLVFGIPSGSAGTASGRSTMPPLVSGLDSDETDALVQKAKEERASKRIKLEGEEHVALTVRAQRPSADKSTPPDILWAKLNDTTRDEP
ncbi:hypothetical protein GGX14DRAFT_586913 [Mycena pura]|uniref:Uncharacterized protein n=1 Tax=Mycena pura TaxID=153505 RepID=A0AAD6USY7_9AGAR|nr:hypothetical protein GGX14DRAFT_586913 [Mycena pura]